MSDSPKPSNGNGKVVSYVLGILAAAGALAAIVEPMRSSISAAQKEIERVERQAAESRTAMEIRFREAVSHAEDLLRAAIETHTSWALDQNSNIESILADLKERTRGLESALVENETQHKWVADEINGLHSELERRSRAYWDGTRIVWPDVEDEVLEQVGEAVRNGKTKK